MLARKTISVNEYVGPTLRAILTNPNLGDKNQRKRKMQIQMNKFQKSKILQHHWRFAEKLESIKTI